MSFLIHFLRASDFFVDIGANSGSFTILASSVSGARVEAFEPLRATCDRLLANVKLNAVSDRVTVKKIALGSAKGFVKFSTNLDSMNHVLRDGECEELSVSVPRSTLDAEIETAPQLLKIDVEGFEYEVLSGAPQNLSSSSLQAIIIELNGSGVPYGHSDDEVATILISAGFKPVSYDPKNRKIQPLNSKSNRKGNTIFVRDLDFVQSRVKNGQAFTVNGIQL